MNDSQEFFDKWLCPTYDDIVDKIKLEQGLYCEFEKKTSKFTKFIVA